MTRTPCEECNGDGSAGTCGRGEVWQSCTCLCHRVIELERQIAEIDRRIDTRIVNAIQKLGVMRRGAGLD